MRKQNKINSGGNFRIEAAFTQGETTQLGREKRRERGKGESEW